MRADPSRAFFNDLALKTAAGTPLERSRESFGPLQGNREKHYHRPRQMRSSLSCPIRSGSVAIT